MFRGCRHIPFNKQKGLKMNFRKIAYNKNFWDFRNGKYYFYDFHGKKYYFEPDVWYWNNRARIFFKYLSDGRLIKTRKNMLYECEKDRHKLKQHFVKKTA